MGVAIGVDSHKSSLAVGVLDEIGRTVGVSEFANDRRGHDSLIEWIDRCGPERVIGIEGAGNYGAGLARLLLQTGEDVRVTISSGSFGVQEICASSTGTGHVSSSSRTRSPRTPTGRNERRIWASTPPMLS